METADIRYRVADFLKQYAPFHAADDEDLLALAERGRVKFYEPNEYVLWQGEPHKPFVFVIQQGTVSLWDEAGSRAELRDVRGAGDMLGIERYHDSRACLYSARSESDVVVYAFPASDFEAHILKYPRAVEYVEAEGRVTPDYKPISGRREPQRLFLHDVVGRKPVPVCRAEDSIADVARALLVTRSGAIVVLDADDHARAVLTSDHILGFVAAGGGDTSEPVLTLVQGPPVIVGPNATVTDGVLAMGQAEVDAVAITADGTANGRVQALVTPRDLAPVFGDQPAALLRDIRLAATVVELRELNRRCRAFVLEFLSGAGPVEWLTRFSHLADVAIVTRVVSLTGLERAPACWCFCGSSGRAESLTLLAPHLLVVLEDGETLGAGAYERVLTTLQECDYLPRLGLPFDTAFYVATVSEWKARYRAWVSDPIGQQTYQTRTLFDLRPVLGRLPLCRDIEVEAVAVMDRSFLHLVANDCLANLPPLTFFQDAVVDRVGEQSATFRLEESALRPLVDVGRVVGMAARQAFGRSTLERFAIGRRLLPEHAAVFREAADTLQIVLWQQGRVGISQGTRGAELPPGLLSRHDRQVLKSGFRSILRLLELTGDRGWLDAL